MYGIYSDVGIEGELHNMLMLLAILAFIFDRKGGRSALTYKGIEQRRMRLEFKKMLN